MKCNNQKKQLPKVLSKNKNQVAWLITKINLQIRKFLADLVTKIQIYKPLETKFKFSIFTKALTIKSF